MGNPTNELRAKLDERGIAYETPSTTCTEAYINSIEYTFYEYVEPLGDNLEGKVFATTEWLTPEQAIAATMGERNPDGLPIGLTVSNDGNLLNWVGENYVRQDAATVGRGNLTAEQVREAIMSADRWRKPMGDTGMTNTHLIIRDDGWQAIADELNAAVGVGTCHFKVVIDQDPSPRHRGNICECDKCGYRCARGFIEDERFKYCPNCGARVVSE